MLPAPQASLTWGPRFVVLSMSVGCTVSAACDWLAALLCRPASQVWHSLVLHVWCAEDPWHAFRPDCVSTSWPLSVCVLLLLFPLVGRSVSGPPFFSRCVWRTSPLLSLPGLRASFHVPLSLSRVSLSASCPASAEPYGWRRWFPLCAQGFVSYRSHCAAYTSVLSSSRTAASALRLATARCWRSLSTARCWRSAT